MAMHQNSSIKFIKNSHLKSIELRYSQYNQRIFDKHTHDTYSVGIVTRGQTEFFSHNRIETIRRGNIALINPGEVHACNPSNGSTLTYYMFYIEPDLIREISSALSGKGTCQTQFNTSLICDDLLYDGLIELIFTIETKEDDCEIEELLYDILAVIIKKYGNIVPEESKRMQCKNKVIEDGRTYLMDNLFQNIPLHELASNIGLSKFYFLREFRRLYKLPPHTYQLQQRINVAKRLLVNDKPIAHVATEVGFADQSHFTRKFKAFVGATPRQYQLANR